MANHHKKFLLGLLCGSLFFCMQAQAQDTSTGSSTLPKPRAVEETTEWRPHVGLMLGVNSPEGSYRAAPEYALDVGYQPYIPFGLGLEIATSRIEQKDDGDALSRTMAWVKGSYHFGGDTVILKDSYVGVGLGAAMKSDGTDIASAPLLGFDIPFKNANSQERAYFSLGAHAKYMVVSGSDPDALSLNGVMKYWY